MDEQNLEEHQRRIMKLRKLILECEALIKEFGYHHSLSQIIYAAREQFRNALEQYEEQVYG